MGLEPAILSRRLPLLLTLTLISATISTGLKPQSFVTRRLNLRTWERSAFTRMPAPLARSCKKEIKRNKAPGLKTGALFLSGNEFASGSTATTVDGAFLFRSSSRKSLSYVCFTACAVRKSLTQNPKTHRLSALSNKSISNGGQLFYHALVKTINRGLALFRNTSESILSGLEYLQGSLFIDDRTKSSRTKLNPEL